MNGKKPISLIEAAKILASKYPEYAFDRQQLRRMCIAGKIPCCNPPICGLKKAKSYLVRIEDIVKVFRSWEKPMLKWK